jgi:hypothetical protein
MLQIKGNQVKRADKKLLRIFSKYVLDKYVTASTQAEATIIIKFIHPDSLKTAKERREFRECRAWSEYDGRINGKRHFTIEIALNTISKRTKVQIKKLREAMECLGHELIHVKQYLNNEMFDYANEDVRYKGKVFTDWKEGEAYYFSPWEIEAYGHEIGLYKSFKAKLKEEAKAK